MESAGQVLEPALALGRHTANGITQGNTRPEARLDPLQELVVGGTQRTRLPLTEPVELRLGLDIAVTHHPGLAGEPDLVLVADLEPADGDADLFEQGLGSEILHTLGNVNPAFAALTETSTVQDTLDARVELDLISDSHITQLLALFAFNGLLFPDKGNLWHIAQSTAVKKLLLPLEHC